MNRILHIATLAIAAFMAAPLETIAQTFPSKPIHVIVPFPPGGVDLTARLLTMKMSENIGQPVVLENRGGANGMIGSELVARSAPDGYMTLFTTPSTHITAVYLSKNVPYDPIKDFTPICIALEPVGVLLVNPSTPANSLKEWIDYVKRNPGKLTYSTRAKPRITDDPNRYRMVAWISCTCLTRAPPLRSRTSWREE